MRHLDDGSCTPWDDSLARATLHLPLPLLSLSFPLPSYTNSPPPTQKEPSLFFQATPPPYRVSVLDLPMRLKKSMTFFELPELPLFPPWPSSA